MTHSRTDIEQDDIALQCLSGCEYKTMHYLINRADPIGVSYPKQETIASAIGFDVREVQRALDTLHLNAVFRYRRRNAFNPVTRRKETNVYQVNPEILCVVDEFEAEAWAEWQSLINQCGNVSTRLWSHNNQHQEPTPLTNSRTNSRTNTTKSPEKAQGDGKEKARRKKQNPDGETTQRIAPNNQHGNVPKSSVPPERPQYANPDAINSNLPDANHERLAADLRQFGIAMPLGRGFVVEYGYERVKTAFQAVKDMGEKARQPAAVFRSIVQIRLADDFALAHQQLFKRRGS